MTDQPDLFSYLPDDLEFVNEVDSKRRLEALKQLSIKIRNCYLNNIENGDYTTKKRLQEDCD